MPPVQGFFYNRYKPPSKSAKLGTETDTNVDQQLWYHVVGTPQADDKFVYAVPKHPDWFISAEVTDDGRCACYLKSLRSLWSLDILLRFLGKHTQCSTGNPCYCWLSEVVHGVLASSWH